MTADDDAVDAAEECTLYVEGLPLSANPHSTSHLQSYLSAVVDGGAQVVKVSRVSILAGASATTDSSSYRVRRALPTTFRGYCFIQLANQDQADAVLRWSRNRPQPSAIAGLEDNPLTRSQLRIHSLAKYRALDQSYLQELARHQARFMEQLTAHQARKEVAQLGGKAKRWLDQSTAGKEAADVLPLDYVVGTVVQFSGVTPEAGNSKLTVFFARPHQPVYISHQKRSPVGFARFADAEAAQSCVDYFSEHTVLHMSKSDTIGRECSVAQDVEANASIRVKVRLLEAQSQEELQYWVNIARERETTSDNAEPAKRKADEDLNDIQQSKRPR
ncbi:hypothetical protein RI367_000708 [Sorochytrium milnesiophthora]